MAKLDPKDHQGQSPEVSDREVSLGVYVFQGKDENDQPVGDKKFIEARDPAHAEGFRSVGFRLASEAERKEYRQRVADAKKQTPAPSESSAKEAELEKQLKEAEEARKEAEAKLQASEAERKSESKSADQKNEKVESKEENK